MRPSSPSLLLGLARITSSSLASRIILCLGGLKSSPHPEANRSRRYQITSYSSPRAVGIRHRFQYSRYYRSWHEICPRRQSLLWRLPHVLCAGDPFRQFSRISRSRGPWTWVDVQNVKNILDRMFKFYDVTRAFQALEGLYSIVKIHFESFRT